MSADFSKIICCVRVVFVAFALVCFCGVFVFAEDVDTQKNQAQQENQVQQEDAQSDEVAGAAQDKIAVERFYRDSAKKLRHFTYGDESFVADSRYNGNSMFVSRDSDRVVRRYYDSFHRLKKIETWNIAGGVLDAAIDVLEEFVYVGDSIFPDSSTVSSATYFSESSYDSSGRTILTRYFKIVEKTDDAKTTNTSNKTLDKTEISKKTNDSSDDNTKKETERVLETISSWKYSSDGKLIESTFEQMDEKGKITLFSRSDSFIYRDGVDEDVPPDHEFYEDGELRTKTVYTTASDYEVSYYFDGGFVVTETYEGNHKISETVMQNGTFRRGRIYAQ